MINWFRFWEKGYEKIRPINQKAQDDFRSNLDLLLAIFGTEEAKNHLLNIAVPEDLTEDKVIADGGMIEHLLGTPGWTFYQQALWRNLLTALRRSLIAPTLDEREGKRHEVTAILNDLRVPYNFRREKNRILQEREARKQKQPEPEPQAETIFQQ